MVMAGDGYARAGSATLSLQAVANPVATAGGYLTSSSGCQTYLNPSWAFSSSDLQYQTTGGLNTSSVPCFAIHTDLGTFTAFAGASGADSASAPQGAPESGGAWRTWCQSSLPMTEHGEGPASIQIGSTRAGTATITAYLLRYGQLSSSFTSSIIAQTSFDLVFGAAKTPAPKPQTYKWSVAHAYGFITRDDNNYPYGVLHAVIGSGTVVVTPAGTVASATGSTRYVLFVSKHQGGPSYKQSFAVTPVAKGSRLRLSDSNGVELDLKITVSPTKLQDADLDCLAHPTTDTPRSSTPRQRPRTRILPLHLRRQHENQRRRREDQHQHSAARQLLP